MVDAVNGNNSHQARYLETIATNTGNSVLQMGQLILAIQTILPFSGSFGSFTFPAAASVTVTNASVTANSYILLLPTNAAAGTLVGSNESPYIAAADYVVGTSFIVRTAAATAAAGTETFKYIIINPTG